jgi:hypothetical protein
MMYDYEFAANLTAPMQIKEPPPTHICHKGEHYEWDSAHKRNFLHVGTPWPFIRPAYPGHTVCFQGVLWRGDVSCDQGALHVELKDLYLE